MSEILEKPARARKAAAAPTLTLGQAADKMWLLKDEKKALESQVKGVEAQIKELEETIFGLLDAQDTRKAEGKKASVSINESVVATVEDWEALWPYITKNKYFHLVQKRVSDPGMRELWDMGKKVPGVQPFTKRTLSVRTL
jgi:hypothetical protein